MSLINDALKRARQAQHKQSPPPSPGVPLRPVEAARPRISGPGMLLPVVGLMVIGLVVLVLWAVNWSGAAKDKELASKPTKPAVKLPTATDAPPPAPRLAPVASTPVVPAEPMPAAAVRRVIPETNPPPLAIASPAVAPAVATKATAVLAEAPPPLPKLQGIFYRPDRPSALLNGKTVLIGERSGEFLVVAIDRQSVTLVRAGQTNVLRMKE